MFVSLMRPLRRFFRAFAIAPIAAGVLAAGIALASPPETIRAPTPGADALLFQQALTDWLADNEAAALPVLAALAAQGNTAARLFLGLIDKIPALQGPYFEHLDRTHRIALLRAPGGISGRNWLSEIMEHPLAAAWIALRAVDADATVIDRFRALGEPVAARTALTVLAAREHPSLGDLDPEATDADLLYLLWGPGDPERRAQILPHVPARHPQRALMGEDMDARDLGTWLSRAEAAAPLTTLCAAVCPQEAQAACLTAAYRALNSHNALMTLGTPAEALVPQATFLSSTRGRSSVMRRILLAVPMRGRRAMLARLTENSACLGQALTAENERYRPPLPTVAPTE